MVANLSCQAFRSQLRVAIQLYKPATVLTISEVNLPSILHYYYFEVAVAQRRWSKLAAEANGLMLCVWSM